MKLEALIFQGNMSKLSDKSEYLKKTLFGLN